ncbi:50S ribosome-binding GTPase, partial [bacterium]|nr:50S ribosome-binding GTPase [bacterium]
NRAIVTEIPGTTRDTLEEVWSIGELPVRLIDTAGLRETDHPIEAIGIQKTHEALKSAFLILPVFDSSTAFLQEDQNVLQLVQETGAPAIAVLNKSDLPNNSHPGFFFDIPSVHVSAKFGTGIDLLQNSIEERAKSIGISAFNDLVMLGARQNESFSKAIETINRARLGVGHLYHDLLSADLMDAIRYLGEITGETVDEDILDRIFERFCIGK